MLVETVMRVAQFFHPLKYDVQFYVGYSESESRKLAPADVLKTYNP